ncbi:MAG: GNAT family N-acetyltransferase [Phycisphaerae bacterium]
MSGLTHPLSDYSFSQVFTWRNSLNLAWAVLQDHLCVFANGTELSLLLPPLAPPGTPGINRALDEAFAVMADYNAAAGFEEVPGRVEYVSDEFVSRMNLTGLDVAPMAADYVYSSRDMIDLAGGAFKSKRQERNRFMRDNAHRTERFDPAKHTEGCLALLARWKQIQDAGHEGEARVNTMKRQKESVAAETSVLEAASLGLSGLVVYVGEGSQERLAGFTFGEALGQTMANITIEKVDLTISGIAQFIFSEFCGQCWAERPEINAGDDWGLPTLAWTKQSYRPIRLQSKYAVTQPAPVRVSFAGSGLTGSGFAAGPQTRRLVPTVENGMIIRAAQLADLPAALALEDSCFDAHRLGKRQLRYLQKSRSATFVVAEKDGAIVGDGIALTRKTKQGKVTGRLYTLSVNASARGQGVGRLLTERLLAELETAGAGRVFLEVEAGNAAAIGLYEKLGFRGIGKLPGYYGPGRDGLHMMRGPTPEPTRTRRSKANATKA